MKILITQKITGLAGSEKYLLNILPALKQKKIDVSFLLLYEKNLTHQASEFQNILKKAGINLYLQNTNKIPTLNQLYKTHKLIKKHQFNLVHSNLIYADMFMAFIKFFFNKKLILVSAKHGYEEAYNNKYGFDPSKKVKNLYWYIAKFSEKYINKSFAISKGLHHLYIGLGIVKPTQLSLIRYGFTFDQSFEFRKELRLGNPQLVLVGRLTEFKGHRFAFEAIKLLKQKFPNIKLLVVGKGELEDVLKQTVRSLDIEQHVFFAGFQPNPRDWMFTSDLVLLPSVSEGLGIVLLEAMSCQRVIVAFDVPSPNEIFHHQEDAMLAKAFDINEYAKLVEILLNDPEKRKKMASEALITLERDFNEERMLNETIDFYRQVLKSTN